MSTVVSEHEKREIDLTAGRIRYREAGEGPAIVFVHGFLVDGRLWDGVVDALADRFRCIAPDLPFGAHRLPMSPGADLSPAGMAAIVADLIERLELDDVTVVGNDSGGAVSQVLATTRPERIGRLVLTNCDTHENFPPGIFKALPPLAKLPGSTWLMLQPFRLKAVTHFAFAPFSKADAGRLRRRLGRRRLRRRRRPPRPRQGHRRDEQALHAGGGGGAAGLAAADPAGLGAGGSLLPDALPATARHRARATRGSSRSRAPGPSSRSISRPGSPPRSRSSRKPP